MLGSAIADDSCQQTESSRCLQPDPMVDVWPGQFVGEGANRKRVWSTRTRPAPAPTAPLAPDFTGYFYSPSLQDWILLNRLGPSRFGFRQPRPGDRFGGGAELDDSPVGGARRRAEALTR